MADPGDGQQFSDDNCNRDGERKVEIRKKEGNGVPHAAESSHKPADHAAYPGMSAAGEAAIVGERFCESHADARANGGRESDYEGGMSVLRSECRSENRRQRRNRSIHEAGQTGLNNLQDEQLAIGLLLLRYCVFRKLVLFQFLGAILMRALFLGQIIEQLPNAGVLHASCRALIKTPGLRLHGGSFVADLLQAERVNQPDGTAVNKSFYVLPPNQRDVIAEFAAV